MRGGSWNNNQNNARAANRNNNNNNPNNRNNNLGFRVRYVDDIALFSDSKRQLWGWKKAIIERLAQFRLKIHDRAQVTPVRSGVPWLGFIVYPTHRRLKARKVTNFRRHLRKRWEAFCRGKITFAEFDATVQGWINHARYGDTWGLRLHVLGKPLFCRSGKRVAKCVPQGAPNEKRA